MNEQDKWFARFCYSFLMIIAIFAWWMLYQADTALVAMFVFIFALAYSYRGMIRSSKQTGKR